MYKHLPCFRHPTADAVVVGVVPAIDAFVATFRHNNAALYSSDACAYELLEITHSEIIRQLDKRLVSQPLVFVIETQLFDNETLFRASIDTLLKSIIINSTMSQQQYHREVERTRSSIASSTYSRM